MRVWPTSEFVRKHIKHPAAGGFTGNEGAGDWPPDQFTCRRLVEGDITEVPPAPKAAAKE